MKKTYSCCCRYHYKQVKEECNTTDNIGDIIPYATNRETILELRNKGTYIKYDLYYSNKIRSIVRELYDLDIEYLKENSKKVYSESLKSLLE